MSKRARLAALLAVAVALVAGGCALAPAVVRAVERPAGRLDLGAVALVAGEELALCPDNRTVCGTFYRLDLLLPSAERAHTRLTLARLPVGPEP